MSEYQYVVFQAVDRPLNDTQLKYAQRQSTRADVSRWSLSVEYHYSSFRGDVVSVKANLLAVARNSKTPANWPTTDRQRSFDALLRTAEVLRSNENAKQARKAKAKAEREAGKADRKRKERMKEMVQDPKKWLREAEQLVDARGTHNYKTAAEILYDLREAVGGDEGDKITRRHAAHLARKHPTLNHLKSSLRKRGLLE